MTTTVTDIDTVERIRRQIHPAGERPVQEARVRQVSRRRPRPLDHGGGHVESDRLAPRHPLGRPAHGVAVAAADVEDALVLGQDEPIERLPGGRPVPALHPLGPAAPGPVIEDVGDLLLRAHGDGAVYSREVAPASDPRCAASGEVPRLLGAVAGRAHPDRVQADVEGERREDIGSRSNVHDRASR